MSAILDIYTALAAKTVTIGGVTPTVYSLASLPASAETAITPCRLLLPVGDSANEGREFGFIAIGTTVTVDWQIKDLLLWQSTGQGTGLSGFASDLVEYAGLYADMLRTFKAPSTQSNLQSANILPGVFEYPASSGRFYTGVLCTLTVHEVING